MTRRPTADDFISYMGLTLSADDPNRVTIGEVFDGAQELVESRLRDGVVPDDPQTDDYPNRVRTATFMQANRLYKRKGSPEGVAGFGDLGAVRISGIDPDIEQLLTGLVRLDGFA